jgi:hypothetical protein
VGRSASRFCRRSIWGKFRRHTLHRRSGRRQSRSGEHAERRMITLPGLELRPLGRSARSNSVQLTAVSRLWVEIINEANESTGRAISTAEG